MSTPTPPPHEPPEPSSSRDVLGPRRGDALSAVAACLRDAIVSAAVADLDAPHVVLREDARTGQIGVAGPYRDALAAAVAAEQSRLEEEWIDGAEHAATYRIAPLAAP
ncbi:hypothetical protein ACOACO_02705 [Nocardioides sp. CPCC 205120]|uniref:hypothetical protein n=1 Tax=Nocardioides sp. CPCC 205120 TaxID=3406462 RepID=UPI003B501EF8